MPLQRRWSKPTIREHRHAPGQPSSLYEVALRTSIASQHGLRNAEKMTLKSCDGCGKPYLLADMWLPFAEEGELACPRCGTVASSWDGTRGFVAYWQREAGG
jgi:uncharacterized Zn-finger protein